jgi:outer membrane lipoprotein-sorting protein
MRMMSFRPLGLALAMIAWAGPARAEETLEDVGRHLDNLVRQYRTIRCKIRVTSRMVVNGQVATGEQDIYHEVLRLPDGRTRTRYETRGKSYRQGDQADDVATLSVYDGDCLYDLRRTPKGTYAMKSRPERNPYDPVGRLDIARRQYEARLLPDRTFEGKDVYAIEFVPRVSDETSVTRRMVSYTDRHTGLPIKTISYDADGRVVNIAEVVESALNEDIPADHFEFRPPPGVEVTDTTGGGGQGGAASVPASSPATQARADATQAAPSSRPAGTRPGR